MLIIRKITLNDKVSFQQFCNKLGIKEALDSPEIYWGVFDTNELQGYVKIDFQILNFPLMKDLQTVDSLDPSIIEGLLRGAFHYCFSNNYHIIAIHDVHWLKKYLQAAIDVTEKKLYSDTYHYEINLIKLFSKPCKGRSM